MTMIHLILTAVIIGLISWVLTYIYYRKTTSRPRRVYQKLPVDLQQAIVEEEKEGLSMNDVTALIAQKTRDPRLSGPDRYTACPQCGSGELERKIRRTSIEGPLLMSTGGLAIDFFWKTSCKECDWNEMFSTIPFEPPEGKG
jgi:hypothetical protein